MHSSSAARSGAGVLCAHFCGAEDWDRMRRLNATSLIGGAVLTVLISAAGILLSPLLLRAQGTEEAVCQQAAVYLQLVFAGLIFCFLYNYYAAMLRSCGNSRTPFVILLLSSTLHAALDLLFAGVLSWGIRGVALSTVLCQAISAAACIVYAQRRCRRWYCGAAICASTARPAAWCCPTPGRRRCSKLWCASDGCWCRVC